MMNNFGVFILTHGRPTKIPTYRTIRRHGYTGKIWLILDNEDITIPAYEKKYPDEVYIFDKSEAALITDTMDNEDHNQGVVFARNMTWSIAKELGLDYFIVLDDDYFDWRHITNEYHNVVEHRIKIVDLDSAFAALVKFLDTTSLSTIAMGQGGDFYGGPETHIRRPKRKAMNSFVCSTKRPFKFLGRLNEDVNAYVLLGSQGLIFLTTMKLALYQSATQSRIGGLTELYMNSGTYVKSFFTVMCHPSSTRVTLMVSKHSRLHHRINWNYAVPKIISPEYKKINNLV